jgi:hypothetical protein
MLSLAEQGSGTVFDGAYYAGNAGVGTGMRPRGLKPESFRLFAALEAPFFHGAAYGCGAALNQWLNQLTPKG